MKIPYYQCLETCTAEPSWPKPGGLLSSRCRDPCGSLRCGRRGQQWPTASGLAKRALRQFQKPAEQISQAFKVGFPIRRSMDQSSFAAPHGLSQRITSFIACACQGIHQMPLYHLIVLIAYAHHQAVLSEGQAAALLPFTTAQCHDAINVFDMNSLQARRCTASIMSLRPASRDKSDDARSGNINSINPVRKGPKTFNNRSIIEQTSFLPPSPPQSKAGEAFKRIVRNGLGRPNGFDTIQTPGSLQTYLLFTMHAEHATNQSRSQNLYFSRRHHHHRHLDTIRIIRERSIWWS